MSTARVGALVALLLGVAATAGSAQQRSGEALYREYCRTCHGTTGAPPQRARDQYANIPTLSDSIFLASRSDDSLLTLLRRGAGSGRQRGRDMESFQDLMTEAEMRAVIAFVRTLPNRGTEP